MGLGDYSDSGRGRQGLSTYHENLEIVSNKQQVQTIIIELRSGN